VEQLKANIKKGDEFIRLQTIKGFSKTLTPNAESAVIDCGFQTIFIKS
jgi:hypothetical protein